MNRGNIKIYINEKKKKEKKRKISFRSNAYEIGNWHLCTPLSWNPDVFNDGGRYVSRRLATR